MTRSTIPTARGSMWAAWHDDDAQSYSPRPFVPRDPDEERADIAARVAAISSAVTTGRYTADVVAAAVLAVAAVVDDGGDADDVRAVLDTFGMDGDDILPAPLSDDLRAPAGEYRDADTTMLVAPPAPFPTTFDPRPTRPHAGRSIRGRRVGIYIVGAVPVGDLVDEIDTADVTPSRRRTMLRRGGMTYGRMTADDALDAANMARDGRRIDDGRGPIPALLGTDEYAWHEIVTHKPEPFTTTTNDGRVVTFVPRPYGAGSSVVGAGDMAESGRRRPPRTMRMPTYRTTADEIDEITDDDGRVWRVYRYRTTHDGRYIVAGDGRGWQETRRTKRARVKRPRAATMTRHDAARAVAGTLPNPDAWAMRFSFVDGTNVTATHEPARRRWRVVVSVRLADGTRVRNMTTTKRLATAATAVANAAVSYPAPTD